MFRLPGDAAGPGEHTSTHSELMMCLEQEKLFSHLGKNATPSLTLPGQYFATSGLVSVIFRLKYICSCVVEIHYLYNTFAFKLLGARACVCSASLPMEHVGRKKFDQPVCYRGE